MQTKRNIWLNGIMGVVVGDALGCPVQIKDCLLMAVNLGDDADTVGAVAGGLAGLYYGYEGIPADWLSVIQRRKWIEDMCERC